MPSYEPRRWCWQAQNIPVIPIALPWRRRPRIGIELQKYMGMGAAVAIPA